MGMPVMSIGVLVMVFTKVSTCCNTSFACHQGEELQRGSTEGAILRLARHRPGQEGPTTQNQPFEGEIKLTCRCCT